VTLRPSLRRRLPFLVLALVLLAFLVAVATYNPLIALPGLLFVGFGAANAAVRMFHPRSYVTELDDHEFRVHDYRGRLVHRVPWADVVRLTVFNGNSMRGPGTALHLAWRCDPPCPRRGRQPWSGGGRNFAGERFDGALPDPYLGIDRMLELFAERVDAAKARVPSRLQPSR
jgi:hypothetical protein